MVNEEEKKGLRHEMRILQEKLDDHTLSVNQHDAYRHRLKEIRDTLAGNSEARIDKIEKELKEQRELTAQQTEILQRFNQQLDEFSSRLLALEKSRETPKKEPTKTVVQEASNSVKARPEVKEIPPSPPSDPSILDLL